jgi:hypothetical protein
LSICSCLPEEFHLCIILTSFFLFDTLITQTYFYLTWNFPWKAIPVILFTAVDILHSSTVFDILCRNDCS